MTEPICTVYADPMYEIFGGMLTGYTRRAAVTLLHLVDLWSISDGGHEPHVVRSIWELLTSHGVSEHRGLFEDLLCLQIDEGLGYKLLGQLSQLDELRGARP